jgi:uncharacterized repeat protein (TIGR01451 family)
VSAQGIVTSAELPTVPTDDPDTVSVGDATVTPIVAAPLIRATKQAFLVVDADGDDLLSPGDTLEYHIEIANDGNEGATSVAFSAQPDPNTSLVVGSVQTSQGTITAGNNAGDTGVGVTIGNLFAGSSLNLSFQVTVNDPLPASVRTVGVAGWRSRRRASHFSDFPHGGWGGAKRTKYLCEPGNSGKQPDASSPEPGGHTSIRGQ